MPTVNVSILKVYTPPKSAIISKITKAIPPIIAGFNDGSITFLTAPKFESPKDFAALNILIPTDES